MSQPGPDEANWYVCLPGGEPDGPLSTERVLEGVNRGAFPPGSMVCRVGENDWKPVEAVQLWGDGTELMDDSTTVNDDMVDTQRRIGEGPAPRRGGPGGTLAMPAQAAHPAPPPPWQASHAAYPSNTPPPHASNAPPPASQAPPNTGLGKSVIAVVLGGAVLGLAALAVGGLWLMQRGATTRTDAVASSNAASRASEAPSGSATPEVEPTASASSVAPGPRPAPPSDVVESRCQKEIGLPDVLCTWVVATSEGREAERPSYESLQTFFEREQIMRAKGRVHSEPLRGGLVKATLDGKFGYCLRPSEPVESGALYLKWVRKHEGTREISVGDGKTETCVILEEVPVIGPIDDLMSADSPAEREKLAKVAVKAIAKYEPLARKAGAR